MKEHELLILAQQINKVHRLCVAAEQHCVEQAIYAGEMLGEAKRHIAQGDWGLWLEENFEGSTGKARTYMRLARHREVLEANPQRTADMTLREALLYIGDEVAR